MSNKPVPKKSMGQNFLRSQTIVQQIVKAADIKPNDTIIEIGPGLGALTLALAQKAEQIIAIEKDEEIARTLAKILRQNQISNVKIIENDALSSDLKLPAANYKLVSNLPYNIAAAIIMKFLEAKNPPELMVVMVQKEVGQRICAKPPKMNKLAVFTRLYSLPKIIGYADKKYFYPKPKVDGAILLIKPYPPAAQYPAPRELFSKIVTAGFSQPRKQLVNNFTASLAFDRETIIGWLNQNNIKPSQRAESLTIDDWQKLTATFPE
ncbi:MAG: 16S rRNA (adenine(1518)-N(6)/adenine(1519)-N(6))-dimethyltransferase RsmA [Candidatus Pacebacteria bacterium]|nr:16S rRNA (adenine(1518)-N(6)/adenine(1519)-N(6))-dimethyltransferase RsmA [Candidatus Paceibacterota bacterium]